VFEHFTDSARRVLVLAQDETQRRNERSIDPEHLLLAMLGEGEGTAAKALSASGVDYSRTAEVIGGDDGEHARSEAGTPPLSAATMDIIERSVQISWDRADGAVDTEHLLVALLEREDEATESVLAELDITPQEVMQQVDALSVERSL
jgi:ATP-dependent Clp protease ATP-binding subunit ClpA